MYNGIGLATPRGSGTSGHIQRSLSAINKPKKTLEQFQKEIQQLRDNVLPPPRKANPEIIMHQRKRQILIKTMQLRKKLQQQKVAPEQIQKRVKKAETLLMEKLQKGELQTKAKDSHMLSEAKEKDFQKLRDAFGLSKDYKYGSAFDFEQQEKRRVEGIAQKESKRKKFTCPHERCQKTYEIEKELQRHIKYKHDGKVPEVEQKKKKEEEAKGKREKGEIVQDQ